MRRWSYFKNFRPRADLRTRCSERRLGAHCVNSIFALRALAAQKLLHLLGFQCRIAAKKPAIHADRSERGIFNSQTADKTAVQFRAFADAASSRRCCGNFLAMQRVSPKRPFGSENLVSLVRPSLRDDLSIKLATRLTIKP